MKTKKGGEKKRKGTKKEKEVEITRYTLRERYGLTPMLISKYLPEPRKVKNPVYASAAPMMLWKEKEVEKIISENEELQRELEKRRARRIAKERAEEQKNSDAEVFLSNFSPDTLFEYGKKQKREFILHVGPTNSGKTFEALQELKRADSGVYLGPLRMLALEVSETFNEEGIPCNLLTGEESEVVPKASITASTIELCDYGECYDVAVIDEAQLIGDSYRGHHWLKAIVQVNARKVHVCLAPEALSIVLDIVRKLGAIFEIREHTRMVPLVFSGVFRNLDEVQPGDALITFSRRKVLQIAALLEENGIRTSVVYGALPPASRKEEVRRFVEKETTVIVATDAIGLGITLPIRRIIFTETEKFDGEGVRQLYHHEVKQIAGRAGRFGKYDQGEVLTMEYPVLVQEALLAEEKPIERLRIAFPMEALNYDYPLGKMLQIWNNLPDEENYSRADMRNAEILLQGLGRLPKDVDKKLIFRLVTCPLDVKNDRLVHYWSVCCRRIIRGEEIFKPVFEENSLYMCELQYRAFDIYHQLLRRIGVEDNCQEEKERLCGKINEYLREKKTSFLKRCRICGKKLEISGRYSICEDCYSEQDFWVYRG